MLTKNKLKNGYIIIIKSNEYYRDSSCSTSSDFMLNMELPAKKDVYESKSELKSWWKQNTFNGKREFEKNPERRST